MPLANDPRPREELAGPTERTVASALQLGALVGERYRLEAPLGRGGMGVVYAAVHVHTQRAVALKLIDCAWDDATVTLYRRFLGEARTASSIHHRNVVDVLDMGYHDGAPYLVMERLTGETLEQALERLGTLPLETLLVWLLPIMGALAVVHENGIVHRDVKPANIFLAQDAAEHVVPKLLDFGLARSACEAPLTEPGMMLGTPQYMAPERARGQVVGPHSDVWALGVVLFECLCGKLPFSATNLSDLAVQVVTGQVLKVHSVKPDLAPGIAAVIDRALTLAPEERHPDMASFARALGLAAAQTGVAIPRDPDPIGLPNFSALQTRGEAGASGPSVTNAQASTERTESTARSRRAHGGRRSALGLTLTFGLLMIGAGAATWSLAQRARTAPPPLTAATTVPSLPAPLASAPWSAQPAAAPAAPSAVPEPLDLRLPSARGSQPQKPLPLRTRGDAREPTRGKSQLRRAFEPLTSGAREAPAQRPNGFEKEWL